MVRKILILGLAGLLSGHVLPNEKILPGQIQSKDSTDVSPESDFNVRLDQIADNQRLLANATLGGYALDFTAIAFALGAQTGDDEDRVRKLSILSSVTAIGGLIVPIIGNFRFFANTRFYSNFDNSEALGENMVSVGRKLDSTFLFQIGETVKFELKGQRFEGKIYTGFKSIYDENVYSIDFIDQNNRSKRKAVAEQAIEKYRENN